MYVVCRAPPVPFDISDFIHMGDYYYTFKHFFGLGNPFGRQLNRRRQVVGGGTCCPHRLRVTTAHQMALCSGSVCKGGVREYANKES